MKRSSAQVGAGHTAALFGFSLCLDSPSEILGFLLERLNLRQQTHVLTLNPEMLVLAHRDPQTASLLRQADLTVADGAGIVWAARTLLGKRIQRYAGIDLATDLLSALARQGGSVYLLGAAPGVAEQAAVKLTAQMPGLRISGCQHGFFGPEEADALGTAIAASGTDMLLVGMGCPRQEGFISMYRASWGTPILIGVGGALDVWSGKARRAPAFLRKLGLEWLWRALSNTTRFGRLRALCSFVWLVLSRKLSGRRMEAGDD